MIKRLIDFYNRFENQDSTMSHIWRSIYLTHYANLGDALLKKNESEVKNILDSLVSDNRLGGLGMHIVSGGELDDYLTGISQMIGILPFHNPEQPAQLEVPDISYIAGQIEHVTGMKLSVPDCMGFKMNCCLPHAYLRYVAAWLLITRSFGIPKTLLEIGGGIGFLGYISRLKGVSTYASLDLPIMTVCSAYFTSHHCPHELIWLHGETENLSAFARFYSSTNYSEMCLDNVKYDTVFNSDSFPEMTPQVQDSYLNLMLQLMSPWGVFISINHESSRAEQRRVYEACQKNGKFKLQSREPWPMRPGYVVETWKPHELAVATS